MHLGLYIETVISLPALQPVHPYVSECHGEHRGDLITEGFLIRSINLQLPEVSTFKETILCVRVVLTPGTGFDSAAGFKITITWDHSGPK